MLSVPCWNFSRQDPRTKRIDRNLILVMTYDLLFGNGSIQGGGAAKKLIMSYSNALNSALVRAKIRKGVAENSDLLPPELQRDVHTPRYARINTLVTSANAVEQALQSRGFLIRDYPEATGEGAESHGPEALVWDSPGDPEQAGQVVVYRDNLVPDLLLFRPGTDLHADELVASGQLILQDKASCFSALALADLMRRDHYSAPGSSRSDSPSIIDGCAAPGNKSLHIAALLNRDPDIVPQARVLSFEIDPQRHTVLKQRLKQYRADEVVSTHLGSFLDSDPQSFRDVRGILLDPTCSGSGMVQRLDFWLKQLTDPRDQVRTRGSSQKRGHRRLRQLTARRDADVETLAAELEIDGIRPDIPYLSPAASADEAEKTLSNLADFQFSIIDHAMNFPSVEYIVYSTCSVHRIENEDVVARILAKHGGEWRLAEVLPRWHRRGKVTPELPDGALTVRCSPREDYLLGFYVAGFIRKRPASGRGKRGREVLEPTKMVSVSASGSAPSPESILSAAGPAEERRKRKKRRKK